MIRRGRRPLAASLLAAAISACSPTPEPPVAPSSTAVATAAAHAVSPPMALLRDAPAAPRWPRPRRTLARGVAPSPAADAPLAAAQGALAAAVAPALAVVPGPLVTFEGVGDGFAGVTPSPYVVQTAPPDTVGDVGPNHYVQMVNSAFAVFDKATRRVLSGATNTNALFGALGAASLCATTNQGDGLVLYDALADRWLLTQFAFGVDASRNPIAPFFQCVAVSTTPDPTGSYDLYQFGPFKFAGADALNDYPKLGVWPDAYYLTANMFTPANLFLGAEVCALDRARILAGAAATMQCFEVPNDGGLLPADLDGRRAPPAGSPGYVLAFDPATQAGLQFWRAKIDWATPANSALLPSPGAPITIPVSAFVLGCSITPLGNCIPQPGTATQLDTLGDRLMHRLAYRNFGDHESLVVTHTVDTAAGVTPTRTALRWYELQNAAGATLASAAPVVAQSGTYSPDATYRWMGSAAQDEVGDIAIGYSAASATLAPGLRYTARVWSDSPGVMAPGEAVLFAGQGSQVNPTSPPGSTAGERWGDYSALSVDPTDECTFWYTSEYLPASGSFNWHTRIGTFRLPTCPPAYAVALPSSVTVGQAVSVTVTAKDALGTTLSGYGGPASVTSDDPGATFGAGAGAFASGSSTFTVTFAATGSHTLTVADPFSPNLRATAATTVTSTAAPVRFEITGLPTATAGTAATYTVTAVDALGNPAAFSGAAALTSSDARALFTPPTLTFAGGVSATGQIVFGTSGTQTLTLTSIAPALTGTATVAVAPGAPTALALVVAATVTAGATATATLTASDAFGNVCTNLASAVAFTSSDPGFSAPATALSAGVAAAGLRFTKAGAQTVTAALASAPGVKVTRSTAVVAAAASQLALVSGAGQSGTVGAALAQPLVVAASDAFGNPVSGVTVAFDAPAGGSVSPASAATSADGTASTVVTLGTASGAQAFGASSSGLAGSPLSASAAASPGAATALALTGVPATVQAGEAVTVTVSARDAFGNLASGTASLTTSDAGASVTPATLTLAADAPSATITFRTAGAQTITAQDGALSASASTLVTAPAPTNLTSTSKGGCGSAGGGVDPAAALGALLALARAWRRRRA